MKNIIPKLGLSLLVGSCLLTSSLSSRCATSGNSLWDCCKLEGCWEIGAAAVWQQACVQNFIFANDVIITGRRNSNNVIDVKPKFNWGFKVWAGWYSCDQCNFGSLVWKHLWSHKDSRTYNRRGLLVLKNFNSFVSRVFGRQATEYDTVYLNLGRTLYCGCGARFYGYGSVRYVRAEVRQYAKDDLGERFGDKSRFQGGGLEAGLGGEYRLGCNINLVGQLGGMVLLGRRSHGFFIGTRFAQYLVDTAPHVTKCVPGIDSRLGINYTYDWCACGCNLRLVAEIGWEMEYYWNMLVLQPYVVHTHLETTNFGTNGPYGSLALRF